MNETIQKLWKDREDAECAFIMHTAELLELCERHEIPRVTIFIHRGEGWYDMQGAYVLTHRTDADEFIWHISWRGEFGIFDASGKNRQALEEWDPQAKLFVHSSIHEGSTNIDPVERMRERKRKASG
ncbi:MAG: hypothetical protein G01um101425_805 [Candidatus Peregrinibacteria bacterium Gr01-1014_25]|nr:MAG: hypothetical protein G01um101425_805 [Candidatus Peregrinibacteria bacterium Gr01-1014_25]